MQLKSMREGFGEALVELGEKDTNVVVVCADLVRSIKIDDFKNKFPERLVEVGVAEQNLVTVASGIASCGKTVFAASYAAFSPGRNWEQIRTTICINNQPVIVVGSHAGITVGPDGATHQALEDIALMRALPNMIVLSPCDAIEAKKATLAAAKIKKPVYIRFPRNDCPVITTEETPFEIGKAQVIKEGPSTSSGRLAHATIIATGQLVYQALEAAKELEGHEINIRVINVSTIKPLDTKCVLSAAEETGAVITLEEHQITGGLGGAVCELLTEHFPVPVIRMGIKDKYGESGTPEELLEKYDLTVSEIIKNITSILRLKHK